MADEHGGQRDGTSSDPAPWTKLFGAFKVAIDPKKLLLAAAGIFFMSLGWWALSAFFFAFRSEPPQPPTSAAEYDDFRKSRRAWNLIYEMSGPLAANMDDAKDKKYIQDLGDVAEKYEEYQRLDNLKRDIEDKTRRLDKPLGKTKTSDTLFLKVGDDKVQMSVANTEAQLDKILTGKKVRDLSIVGEGKDRRVTISGEVIEWSKETEVEKVRQYIREAKTEKEYQDESRGKAHARDVDKVLPLLKPRAKPAGLFRTWPWFEDRGPNPYLLVTRKLEAPGPDGVTRTVPWERGQFAAWFLEDQAPVLVEPLYRFLQPVIYLFDSSADIWSRFYLLCIIVWSLAVWAVFGGAITRIAVVQVARPTERVGLSEALKFAWSRKKSFLSAPLFPLIFVAILTLLLAIFGLIEVWTFFVGDILAGIAWPIVLLFGLIMAVTLVGLIGYPLMYATISAEGSDSFDAISRSYSYVYQSPWNYLWYGAVAIAYGAVLVFFVGFMGSLMVYLGKWGMSQWSGLREDRDPAYLCVYAPTSFGWRDLLLHNSPREASTEELSNSGKVVRTRTLQADYLKDYSITNKLGAWMVSVWLYLFFLMIVGFGYSFFWTAASVIYLLMRRRVDDTDFDEIYLEDEELDEPYPMPPLPEAEQPPAEGAQPTMVEAPSLRSADGAGSADTATGAPAETPAAPTEGEHKPPAPAGGAS